MRRAVLLVIGIDGVQVDFSQVAVEVTADDLTTGVETIAIHAVLQLTLVRGLAIL